MAKRAGGDGQVTVGEKRASVRGQMSRGTLGAGKRDRCKRGKSCGLTCIAANMDCVIDFPMPVQDEFKKLSQFISQRKSAGPSGSVENVKKTVGSAQKSLPPPTVPPTPPTPPPASVPPSPPPAPVAPPQARFLSYGTKVAIKNAEYLNKELEKKELQRVGDTEFNKWGDSLGKEAPILGKGMYGTVAKSKDGTYAVKRGDVSDTEVSLMSKLGAKDLGPSLIAADLNGPGNQTVPGVNIRRGRVAMTIVPGRPSGGDSEPDWDVNGVKLSDAYWKARADLHRLGVAHNDMHTYNVLIDDKGKARFVDLGLAQDNPKAALSEALGAFKPPADSVIKRAPKRKAEHGDWQVQQYNMTAGPLIAKAQQTGDTKKLEEKAPYAARALRNLSELEKRMEADGFSRDEIGLMRLYGIRNDPSVFTKGIWKKLSDEQAMEYIDILYDGI